MVSGFRARRVWSSRGWVPGGIPLNQVSWGSTHLGGRPMGRSSVARLFPDVSEALGGTGASPLLGLVQLGLPCSAGPRCSRFQDF